jgi:hypothetical protein
MALSSPHVLPAAQQVPAKERLMALAALLRSRTARRRPGGTKVRAPPCLPYQPGHAVSRGTALWAPVRRT